MLTPYDEFLVHQAPYPFSYIPVSDYSWDDGNYFAAMSPERRTQLCCGVRVNPNTDMIGGYALLNVEGHQTTLRFSRCWRRNFEMEVGPLRIRIVEPLRKIHITLGDNPSRLQFEMLWEGTSPPILEKHHIAENRGRRTTDQTRYTQAGKVGGWMDFQGVRTDLDPEKWFGSRDHSWGVYASRPPLGPQSKWLPPAQSAGPRRALRFWAVVRTGEISGHYEINETPDGLQVPMNDVLGVPFSGKLFRGWNEEYELAGGRHELEYHPGSRLLKRGCTFLTDVRGGQWKQEFEVTAPPWYPVTMGYTQGSWKDGGTFHTYHGSEALAMEWDEFDFSRQPLQQPSYLPAGTSPEDTFNCSFDAREPVYGQEYIMRVKTFAPDGQVYVGGGQVEHMISPPYLPYGFK